MILSADQALVIFAAQSESLNDWVIARRYTLHTQKWIQLKWWILQEEEATPVAAAPVSDPSIIRRSVKSEGPASNSTSGPQSDAPKQKQRAKFQTAKTRRQEKVCSGIFFYSHFIALSNWPYYMKSKTNNCFLIYDTFLFQTTVCWQNVALRLLKIPGNVHNRLEKQLFLSSLNKKKNPGIQENLINAVNGISEAYDAVVTCFKHRLENICLFL